MNLRAAAAVVVIAALAAAVATMGVLLFFEGGSEPEPTALAPTVAAHASANFITYGKINR